MSLDKTNIKSNIEKLGRKYGIRQVFEDFVICSAYSLSNLFQYSQEREDCFNKIQKKYTKEEFSLFANMLASLVTELNKEETTDILGSLYEEFGFDDKGLNQFFTPLNIVDLVGRILFDKDTILEEINNNGYTCINDPCCGSGRFSIGYYKVLKENNINLDKVCFLCGDLSNFCCCMTYVTLSLLGLNAIVNNQNTLTYEIFDSYITPTLANNKELFNKIIELNVKKSEDKDLDEEIEK